MPMKNPPHPGDLVRTEIVQALGLEVSKAAEILNVRQGVRPAHGPPSPHATRLRRGETREHARGISIKRYVPT